MADRYWVGGAGTWDTTTTHWSATSGGAAGASVPTSSDNAIFNASSGGGAVTVSGSRTCLDLNCTGFTGTLTGTASPVITLSGSLTLASGMVFNTTSGPTLTFNRTTAGGTITTAGKTVRAVNIGGTGLGLALQDALTSNAVVTLNAGTLALASYSLTCSAFASSNSNARTLSFGTGQINCTGSGPVWSMSTVTNLTVTGTPVVNVTSVGSTGITVATGPLSEANSISFNFTGGTYPLSFATSSFKHLDFTGYAGTQGVTSSGLTIYGDFKAASGIGSFGSATFKSTSATTRNITTFGVPFTGVTFDGAGGSWRLQDALTLLGSINFTRGSFSANGYNVTANAFISNNSNVRVIDFGSGTWTLASDTSTFFMPTATNATLTGSGVINFTGPVNPVLRCGGSFTFPAINLGSADPSVTLDVYGSHTFKDFTVSDPTLTPTINFWNDTTFKKFSVTGFDGSSVVTIGGSAILKKHYGWRVGFNSTSPGPGAGFYAEEGGGIDWLEIQSGISGQSIGVASRFASFF